MRRSWPVHSCRHSSHLKNQRKSLVYRKKLQQQQQQNQSSRKMERKVVPTAKIYTPWLRSFCAGSWTLSCDLPSVMRMQIWKLKSHKFITLSAFFKKKNACRWNGDSTDLRYISPRCGVEQIICNIFETSAGARISPLVVEILHSVDQLSSIQVATECKFNSEKEKQTMNVQSCS